MATLAQFSKNIRRRGRQVENSGTRIVKAVSSRALRSLVMGTPVDKGVARSNWRVGIGAPTRAVIRAYAPGSKLGLGESANANAAIAAGLARINSVTGKSGVGLITSIYISNATPYIEKLNNSHPSQAGWVDVALIEAKSEIAGFRVFSR